ncbi:MAG: hypothetical protein ABIA76_05720 [Candidatus Diapherotrites archaeon]
MGKMVVIFRINPKEQELAEKCLEDIKTVKQGEFRDAKMDSPGFGIKIVKAAYVLPDKVEDAVEKLTQEINSMDSVEDAEVEGMNLL